jgi:hypothetical protein
VVIIGVPAGPALSEEPFNAAEVGLKRARVLEARGVPYALGGALAYGV